MYLSKIELNGFKSFANKTIFNFTPQTTAIVGPNGSGKSNVVDAIRWVTGEQSLKNLRGKKSQDVIFSGSKNNPRSAMAEVSLFLNNEDKRLDLEYSTVIITRRLYQNGESEYLINKNKVKLQDIIILLAKANFGQKSYGIISQGMTDYILTCTPRDRKLFFDEAAGVKHHQIKRDQAINRLARSQENLNQGSLMLKEIEPRLKILQRQVDKLNRRKELETELEKFQFKYYGFVWSQIEGEKLKYDEVYSKQSSEVKHLEKEINTLQESLDSLAKEESQQEIFKDIQQKYEGLNTKKNKLSQELSINNGKLNLEYHKTGQQNVAWMENKKSELKTDLKKIKSSLSDLETKESLLKNESQTYQEKIKTKEQELQVLKNNLESLERELNSANNEKGAAYKNISVEAVLSLKESIFGIYGTIKNLGQIKKSHEVALSVTAGNRLNAIVVENKNTAIECINYLKKNHLPPLTFLPLTELNVYPPKESIKKLAASNGSIGLAVDLIKYEPQYAKAFEFVFGGTLIIEDTEVAKRFSGAKERMVTLEGDVFEKTGTIQGGHRSKKFFSWESQKTNQPDKKIVLKQISETKESIFQKADQLGQLKNFAEKNQVEIKVLFRQKEDLNNGLKNLEAEISKLTKEIEGSQISPDRQNSYFKDLKKENSELEKEINSLDEKISTLQQEINTFNISQDSKKRQVFDLQEKIRQTQADLNLKNSVLNETNIYLAKIEARQDSLKRELAEELGDDFDIDKIKNQDEIDIEDTWKKIRRLKSSLEAIGSIDPETIDDYNKTKERFDFISQQVDDLTKTIDALDKLINDLDKIIKEEFHQAFKQINENFNTYFKILFGGGKAELKLIQNNKDSDDLSDESEPDDNNLSQKINDGLEITATPPGKKIKNLESLSGGEKSMTALALVCAVITYNPPPFVILDEADAALDESNTQKFSEIIDKLSQKTQFIIVTHNRVTMEKAKDIYGITMNSKAISSVVSISLKDAVNSAAR